MSNWKFQESKDLAVITTKGIIEKKYSINFVSHDEMDGGWQFHVGNRPSISDAMVVSLESITRLDPSIVELADLPLGWNASRLDQNSPWIRDFKAK